jgi:hypothetical protein
MDLPATKCKKKLGVLWFVMSGVLFFTVMFQSLLGHYGDRISEVWSWFLPTTLPALSLIAGVFVADATRDSTLEKTVDAFLYRFTFWLSVAYLAAVAIAIFMQPYLHLAPLELFRQSNLWMGPFQGIVSAMLGVFFVKRKA